VAQAGRGVIALRRVRRENVREQVAELRAAAVPRQLVLSSRDFLRNPQQGLLKESTAGIHCVPAAVRQLVLRLFEQLVPEDLLLQGEHHAGGEGLLQG